MSVAAEDRVNSTHKVEVVPVRLEPHPDADTLSVARVFGYQCVVKTEHWMGVSLGAYIPPDSLVPVDRPEFRFLSLRAKADGKYRVKAQKLRGVVSFGLLVPAPAGASEGDDVAAQLGVEHYEPPAPGSGGGKGIYLGGEAAEAPHVWSPKYDLEALRRYADLFEPGEPTYVTEKLDGANARYVYWDGRMHCGSRTEWKKEYPDTSHVTLEFLVERGQSEEDARRTLDNLARKAHRRNLWWENLARYPQIEEFCRDHPNWVLYGEIYGNVNAIKYGFEDGVDRFAGFDILADGKWLDPHEVHVKLGAWGIPRVPVLNPITEGFLRYEPIPFDFDRLCGLAEGETLAKGAKPGTIREGIVVTPATERTHRSVGRVKMKLVSAAYLETYR